MSTCVYKEPWQTIGINHYCRTSVGIKTQKNGEKHGSASCVCVCASPLGRTCLRMPYILFHIFNMISANDYFILSRYKEAGDGNTRHK